MKSTVLQNDTKKNTSFADVRTKTEETKGLRDLFMSQLNDIYWAEKALVKTLPKFIKNATTPELVDALKEHLETTNDHVTRLERIFAELGKKTQVKKCDAMESLIREATQIINETEKGVVRDSGIILSSQKAEHYEIASYTTLASFAYTLGEYESAALLEKTLFEEKDADDALTQIAQTINIEAFDEIDEE